MTLEYLDGPLLNNPYFLNLVERLVELNGLYAQVRIENYALRQQSYW
jgi:hypothetical protein